MFIMPKFAGCIHCTTALGIMLEVDMLAQYLGVGAMSFGAICLLLVNTIWIICCAADRRAFMLTRAAIHKTCRHCQMTVFFISYWNPCFWLVISRFVADFCHLSLEKGFVKLAPGLLIMNAHYCIKQKVVWIKMSVISKIYAYLIQNYLN